MVDVTVDEAVRGLTPVAPSRPRASRLGFEVQTVTPGLAKRLRQASPGGVLVTHVDHGEAAEAGLRSGDIIREVDRHPVRTMADFLRLTRGLRNNRDVTLRIQRGAASFFVAFAVP